MSDVRVALRTGASIRKAVSADIPIVSATLARAFQADPVFAWCVPDDRRRSAMLPAFFELFATTLLQGGGVYATQHGAALWCPPGRLVVPENEAESFMAAMAEISGDDIERIGAVGQLIDEHHPEGDFYYLQFIGVEPAGRGLGIGTDLLRTVLATCDLEGTPAYLEATSPDNRRLYERHGFVAQAAFSPEGCPPLWPMWRTPQ